MPTLEQVEEILRELSTIWDESAFLPLKIKLLFPVRNNLFKYHVVEDMYLNFLDDMQYLEQYRQVAQIIHFVYTLKDQ